MRVNQQIPSHVPTSPLLAAVNPDRAAQRSPSSTPISRQAPQPGTDATQRCAAGSDASPLARLWSALRSVAEPLVGCAAALLRAATTVIGAAVTLLERVVGVVLGSATKGLTALAGKLGGATSDSTGSSMLRGLGLEEAGRSLSRREAELLRPIFGDALAYDAVRVQERAAPRSSSPPR